MSILLQFEQVDKSYGRQPVFAQTSLELRDGLTFLVGKNGAGKSTLIRMATGIDMPDSGSIELLGRLTSRLDVDTKQRFGLQVQNDAFLRCVKVGEYIDLYERLYQTAGASRYEWQKVVEVLDIEPLLGRYAYTLSGGEKKRVSLALASIGDKRLIFLDEPTAGIDVEVKERVIRAVEYLRECEVSLLISSHDLDEFLTLADHVLMVDREVVCDASKAEFVKRFGCYSKVFTDRVVDDGRFISSTIRRRRTLYCADTAPLVELFGESEVLEVDVTDMYELALNRGGERCA